MSLRGVHIILDPKDAFDTVPKLAALAGTEGVEGSGSGLPHRGAIASATTDLGPCTTAAVHG